jgi:hypothetical protein
LLVRLPAGLGMTRTGGPGVVILGKMMKIGLPQCTDGGVSQVQCQNLNQAVFVQRNVIGNKKLVASRFGTPADSIIRADGAIDDLDCLKEASAVAANFSNTLALSDGAASGEASRPARRCWPRPPAIRPEPVTSGRRRPGSTSLRPAIRS